MLRGWDESRTLLGTKLAPSGETPSLPGGMPITGVGAATGPLARQAWHHMPPGWMVKDPYALPAVGGGATARYGAPPVRWGGQPLRLTVSARTNGHVVLDFAETSASASAPASG